MDLLASLGLESALPEQSTRLSSHPGIVAVLQRADDGGVRLGFDACLRCGAALGASDDGGDDGNGGKSSSDEKRATCAGCHRVRYCSPACRTADAEQGPAGDEEEEDAAGHSPVICALLALCDGDETAEEELVRELNPRTHPNGANDGSNGGGKAKGAKGKKRPRTQSEEAARYRVRTEWESYPATLCNVLSEGPDWFVESMTRRLRTGEEVRSPGPSKKRRRGKRDRASMSPTKDDAVDETNEGGVSGGRRRELVLHIVGASSDAELWGWDGTTSNNGDEEEVHEVLTAYAEAATNLHSYLRSLLEASAINIRCVFVGPDCPAGNPKGNTSSSAPCRATVPLPDTRSSTLTIETHRCHYGEHQLPAPDAIVFFNPGLSCPDYDWSNALSTAVAYASVGSIPFLITTNTEMEALADAKCLVDAGCVDPHTLPKDILEAIDGENAAESTKDSTNDSNNDGAFFLGENPYAGLRVRQSGTMGNDLYVKSRWLVGGLFCQQGRKKTKKREAASMEGQQKARKRRRSDGPGGGGSAKRRNPALI